MNRNDLVAQIHATIADFDFDVEAIADEIIQTYGLVDIDTIDTDKYWALVERHDTTAEAPTYDAEYGYTASVGTASDVVAGDFTDVAVGENDADGNMTSTLVLDPVETTALTDDDMEDIEAAADTTLEAHGWTRVGAWQIADNALYATVERA